MVAMVAGALLPMRASMDNSAGYAVLGAFMGEKLGMFSSEPDVWLRSRQNLSIHSDAFGGDYLDLIPIRAVVDEHGQMTVNYYGMFPGRGKDGDIEAFIEIYNPPGSRWSERDYSLLTVEIGKLAWSKLIIKIDGRDYIMPATYQHGVVSPGYLTASLAVRR